MKVKNSNLNSEILKTAGVIHNDLASLLNELSWVMQADDIKLLEKNRAIIDISRKYDSKVDYLDYILNLIETD